jgi:hypothetical protein
MTEPCHSCGAALQDGARFCKRCGAARASDPSLPSGAPYSQAGAPTVPQHGAAGFASHGAPHAQVPPGYQPAAMSSPPPGYPPVMTPPPGYTLHGPQVPAPGSQRSQPWLAIAAAAIAFVLVAAAIVAAVLTSADKGGGVHAATVVTVTVPRAPSSSSSDGGGSEAHHTSTPRTAAGDVAQTGLLGLAPYRGGEISADIPAGWNTVESEAHKTGYVESKWSNPANSNDTVLIDTSPATSETLEQDAAPVHNDLLRASGYRELSYGPGDLTGFASWMWVFRISGDQRVDYFFNRCASGYAVLGSTIPSRFDRLRATFRAVAQSVQPTNRSTPC